MSLDPMPDAATLLRMKAEREGRKVEPSRPLLAAFKSIEALPATPKVDAIALRIPWSALVSDNDKYTVNPRGRGSLILTPEYREAKQRIGALARDVMQGRPAAQCPLSLLARVWLPNNRKHDIVNFAKCVHDALAGTAYQDDMWLHDVRWIRAGVDVDAPRCELTLTPL